METQAATLIPLTEAEVRAVVEAARRRQVAMNRGRAVFACEVREAVGRTPPPCHIAASCIRLEYQWDGESVWQATAWDRAGAILADSVSDGVWIEAGGQRWDIRYGGDLVGDDDTPETVERRIELSEPLRRWMWCRSACENHMFLRGLLTDHVELTAFLPPWLHRHLETGDLIYRIQCYEPTSYRVEFRAWDWIRWRLSWLFGHGLTFDEVMKLPKVQVQNEVAIVLDPDHLYPRSSYMRWFAADAPPGANSREHWLDPVRLENRVLVPRRYESQAEDKTVMYATTLLMEETSVGYGAKLNIRPVDRSRPAVDWI